MPNPTDKIRAAGPYDVHITLTVAEDGKPPFSTTTQDYNDLTYAETLVIQKALADALIGLGFSVLQEIDPSSRPPTREPKK